MYDGNCFTYQHISSIPSQLARITTSYCSSLDVSSLRPDWPPVTLTYGKHRPPWRLHFDTWKKVKKNQTQPGNILSAASLCLWTYLPSWKEVKGRSSGADASRNSDPPSVSDKMTQTHMRGLGRRALGQRSSWSYLFDYRSSLLDATGRLSALARIFIMVCFICRKQPCGEAPAAHFWILRPQYFKF